MLFEYLKNNILITDGAMGTYYAELTGDEVSFCELANINSPELIGRIHREYINSGAGLIRTNTFSANTISMGVDRVSLEKIINSAIAIAKQAAMDHEEVFIAADIGPIPEREDSTHTTYEEYAFIIDTFIKAGIDIFIFETFGSFEHLEALSSYIKQRVNNAFVLTQFAVSPDGYTRKGVSVKRLVEAVCEVKTIDAFGFNCSSGPVHLLKLIKTIDIKDKTISVLPNSGYPAIINERTVYSNNHQYFAQIMQDIRDCGVSILGGCCGTTPLHIKSLSSYIMGERKTASSGIAESNAGYAKLAYNSFRKKLDRGEFVTAVELDPPHDTDVEAIIVGARSLKEAGVDIVTVADSPLARPRVDSVMLSAKIKRETGIDTMPHICCRDKNINALKSSMLAAHIEDIRNVLLVTGDPVHESDKDSVKAVFNISSLNLIELANQLNQEVFAYDTVYIGGALNLNVPNKQSELNRMVKKNNKGASYFLTQPIYEDAVIDSLSSVKAQAEVKLLGGIMPLVSYRNAIFLNNEVPGITIPQKYIDLFKPDMDRETAQAEGIKIAVELAKKIRPNVDGFYFITPFNRVNIITEIINILKRDGVI